MLDTVEDTLPPPEWLLGTKNPRFPIRDPIATLWIVAFLTLFFLKFFSRNLLILKFGSKVCKELHYLFFSATREKIP